MDVKRSLDSCLPVLEPVERAIGESMRDGRRPDGGSRRTAFDMGARIAGPLFVAFGLWLLHESEHDGVSHLFFVSRDGEILLDVSDRLARTLHLGVTCRYLEGGRTMWQRATVLKDPNVAVVRDFVTRCVSGYTRVDPSGLSQRFGLRASTLESMAGRTGLPSGRAFSSSERVRLLDSLLAPTGLQQLHDAGEVADRSARAYLAQEGLHDADGPIGHVDVGWTGSTVQALNELLAQDGRGPVRPYLMGFTARGAVDGVVERTAKACFWDVRESGGSRPPIGMTAVVEALASGSHGPVVDYRVDSSNERWVAVHGRTESVAMSSWHLKELRMGVSAFVDHLLPVIGAGEVTGGRRFRYAARARVEDFVTEPAREYSQVLGRIPHEEDAQGSSVQILARPFSWTDLPALLKRGTPAGRNLSWPQASLSLTTAPLRWMIGALPSVRRRVARREFQSSLPTSVHSTGNDR